MEIREQVVELVRHMINPHAEPLPFGKKNNHVEPTITTPNGEISETLMSGALRERLKVVEKWVIGAAAVLAAGTTVIGFATNISKAYL